MPLQLTVPLAVKWLLAIRPVRMFPVSWPLNEKALLSSHRWGLADLPQGRTNHRYPALGRR